MVIVLCCSCSAAFRRGGGRQKDACGIETRPVDSVTLDEHVCVYTSVYTRFFPARASFIRGIYVQTLLPCLRLGMLHSVGGGAQHAASATGSCQSRAGFEDIYCDNNRDGGQPATDDSKQPDTAPRRKKDIRLLVQSLVRDDYSTCTLPGRAPAAHGSLLQLLPQLRKLLLLPLQLRLVLAQVLHRL